MDKPVSVTKEKAAAQEVEKPGAPAPYAWQPFVSLRKDIDRLFDDFTMGWPFSRGLPQLSRAAVAAPAADVVEREKAFHITMELPGMDEKDLEVVLSDGIMTVRGEKKEERREEKEDYHLTERRYGSFSRSFSLPESVEPEKITAAFGKGVLTLSLPKTKEAQQKQRKVEIKSAA